jgi:insulysin
MSGMTRELSVDLSLLFLISPLLQVSPRNTVLARLFVDLFRDSIAEETYDAELAGLQFSIDYAGDSLTVGTVGYNDKLPAMTEKMLNLMRSFKVDPSRFELIRDQVRTRLVTGISR